MYSEMKARTPQAKNDFQKGYLSSYFINVFMFTHTFPNRQFIWILSGHTYCEPYESHSSPMFSFELCVTMLDSAHAVLSHLVFAPSARLMTSISQESSAHSASCLRWERVSPAYWAWASKSVYRFESGRKWGGFSHFNSLFMCGNHTTWTRLFVSCLRDVYFMAVIHLKLLWRINCFSFQRFTVHNTKRPALHHHMLFPEIKFD